MAGLIASLAPVYDKKIHAFPIQIGEIGCRFKNLTLHW
jgi:hypothetical protein